ncbi:MAG: hypothetical protein DMG13_25880 [Acidobacteria bacterium]|nr:MAG: hypothetical protein DMG13_25880 [Acidobacteriota bacterium]
MSANSTPAASIAALLVGLSLSIPAAAQTTIFNTKDFREDSELWTSPAYYRNNTAGQLRGMAIDYDSGGRGTGQEATARAYGSEGTGRVGALDLASPYSYKSASEHYQAWLDKAGGGTRHTKDTIPDWRGRWAGGPAGLNGGPNPASSVAAMLTPKYREYFVQDVKAAAEGRIWGAGAFCLPGGFFSALGAEEFIVTPEKVWTLAAGNGENYIRWIYTDGSGHTPKEFEFAKWHGESIGFWDRDELIVHTNQIRGWKGGLSEFTDQLETVERYRRAGDRIDGEITLYDPEVFVRPVYAKMRFELDRETRPQLRPLYNTCTDTNGPSTAYFMDERGKLNQRLPRDPLYWDATDPRPWGTWLNESDKRYQQYLRVQGR